MDSKTKSKLEEEISRLTDSLQAHILVKRDEIAILPIEELYRTIEPVLMKESIIPRINLEKLIGPVQEFFASNGLGLIEGQEDEILWRQIDVIYAIATLYSRYQQRERIRNKYLDELKRQTLERQEAIKRRTNIYV